MTIDSVYLGKTPATAVVRAGYRELALSMDGVQMTRELVELSPSSHLSRTFDMSEVVATLPDDDGGVVDKLSTSGARFRDRGSRPSAEELLFDAQSLRERRDWAGAARIYRKLGHLYPESDETKASLISLGEIQLSKLGDPTAAIDCFDRYLQVVDKGPLAQEALLGKARAYRALNKKDAERETLELFLRRFPEAIHLTQVKRRIADL